MRGAYIAATVAAALMVAAAALPGVAALNIENGIFDGLSIQDFTVQQVRDAYGELPETVQVRVNGGPAEEVSTDEALDMMLEVEDGGGGDVGPAPAAPAPQHSQGVGTGPTGSACAPAQIVSVFASGDWGAEVSVEGEDAGPADCFGLPQKGPVASGTVEITNGGFVEAALSNSAAHTWVPGAHCSAGDATGHCGDWSVAELDTVNCVIVVEFAFFGLHIQQLGAGMVGCGLQPLGPTATAHLD